MNLKDFELVSPVIQDSEVLKAIEAAIPPEAISRAIAQTNSQECRIRSLLAPERSLSGDCYEPMVKGLNASSAEEPDGWSFRGMAQGR